MDHRSNLRPPQEHSAHVTVITPFYNTAAYLEECITSIVSQTYHNWDYILVNNCSTDGSEQIAQRYADRYPEKIRVEHNDVFLSQVGNYNNALRWISPHSKYCKIVQADDWIFPDCVRRMVEVGEAHPDAGIIAAYELEGEEVRLDGLPFSSNWVSGRDAVRLYFLRDKYLFGTPTSLLLRSEVVGSRQPFYDERLAPFEDGHACLELMQSWNFGFVHQVLTYSRRQDDSIIARVRDFGVEVFLRFSLFTAQGSNFLTAEEFRYYKAKISREYFLFLAKSACAVHRPGGDFWEFHRKGLASVGCVLNWRLLAPWVPRALLEKAWEGAWRKWDDLTEGQVPHIDDRPRS
jgi:glycosyltransferase involved in cell wall biosynthesis